MSNINFPKMEEEIAEFWEKNQIFKKSVEERPAGNAYIFYDGPPFATGLPHYGHIVASVMKDLVPRYWTMKGRRVERRWGWDCHGLPIENLIEQEKGFKSRADIEACGVDVFNESCRASVLRYADEWKKTVKRIGRFVDLEHDYKTMDLPYMETIWWVFKQLWDKKLIYQGYKPMHICPRCATPLSNFEVTQGYKDVEDISVTVKFEIRSTKSETNSKFKLTNDKPVHILAWTTTPWTLPANVLLAVNPAIKYLVLETEEGVVVLAKDTVETVMKDKKYQQLKEIKGADLVGLQYEPLFPYFKNTPNAFRVVAADFVATGEGTGVVHIAPAFGEDDMKVGEREGLPLVQPVSIDGKFIPAVSDFAGQEVKPKDEPLATDKKIVDFLAAQGKVFKTEKYQHSYPHCWRCDSPLLNYATSSWFVRVTAIKEKILKNNQKMTWVPEHIKNGRFGKWLQEARDWAISRSRYWGSPLPVWCHQTENQKSEIQNLPAGEAGPKCDNVVVVGSIEELEKLSGQKITDLHKHMVDKITFDCPKCGNAMKRIPEVLDCWFESGSMPYAERHYPFENKERFEKEFPADFIAEGQDQTRGWFYTLLVLATALFDQPPAKNVIVNGIVLAEDGQKMSKRLKNYPDPWKIFDTYGVDATRFYLMSSPVVRAENLNFSEKGVKETLQKVVMILWNVFTFYQMYATDAPTRKGASENILDRWIVARLNQLIKETTEQIEKYELMYYCRPIAEFINDLSTWYLRRSRERFKSENEKDKQAALATLQIVLIDLSKIIAPVMPFLAEKIYQEMKKNAPKSYDFKESAHLDGWPEFDKKLIDEKTLVQMDKVRKIVEMGLALRAEAGVKVRQPLSELGIKNYELSSELGELIKDELNVKDIKDIGSGANWKKKEEAGIVVALNTELTDELKAEGLARELTRQINQFRKEAKLTINDRVELYAAGDEEFNALVKKYAEEIKKATLSKNLKTERGEVGWQKEIEIDGHAVWLGMNQ